jgi:hypothetical protein
VKDDATLHDAKLHEAAQRLGAAAADKLDVDRIAARVVERLRSEPAAGARPTWIQPAWLRVAAALLVLVGGGVVLRQVWSPTTTHGAHFVTDDLSDLSADQLRDVLTTLDETLDLGSTTLPEAELDDLDAQQLQAVLRSLEG